MDVIKGCTCAVCLELFADPRVLACGHTYCQKCIEPLLEGAKQKSAQCPECRSKNKQPAKGFPVNYGMLSMVDHVEASAGTRRIGTCNSCTQSAPMTHLYSCTTCKENSATAADADFLVCGMCIAKTHKGHDYQELDVLSKKDVDKALKEVQACRKACGTKEKAFHDKEAFLVGTIARFRNLLEKREQALATIEDDLRSGDALTKSQLVEKAKESEKIKKELEEGVFATAFAVVDECHRKLSDIAALLPQNTVASPEADASVLVVNNSPDFGGPSLLANRRPRMALTRLTRRPRPAATSAQVADTSVVLVQDDDDAVAPPPSQRRRTMRQSTSARMSAGLP